MIRPHMTLAAGRWGSSQGNRRGVPRVTFGTTANAAIQVWFADAMAGVAATLRRGGTLQHSQRIGRAQDGAGMVFFRLCNLLLGKVLAPHHRCPSGCTVATAHELIVLSLVALSTVCRRQVSRKYKSVMRKRLLLPERLVAAIASDTFPGMYTG